MMYLYEKLIKSMEKKAMKLTRELCESSRRLDLAKKAIEEAEQQMTNILKRPSLK